MGRGASAIDDREGRAGCRSMHGSAIDDREGRAGCRSMHGEGSAI